MLLFVHQFPLQLAFEDSYLHLQGLFLADNISFNKVGDSIPILIGVDYYYRVVSNEVLKGDSGPAAVSSES